MSEHISGTLVSIEVLDKRSRYNKKGSSREYKIEQLKKRKNKINKCIENIIRLQYNHCFYNNGKFIFKSTLRNRFRDEETHNILYFYKFKPSYEYEYSKGNILPKFQRQLDIMDYDISLWKSFDFSFNLQKKFKKTHEFFDLYFIDMELNPEEDWEEKILNYIYPKYKILE